VTRSLLTRLIAEAIAMVGVFALIPFGLAEAVHHAGLNPFASPASVEASSPALTTDRAGMGFSR
jgi:hypothetical protein